MTRILFQIGPLPPPRLDKALARDVPPESVLSRSRLARLIAEGAVQLEGITITDPLHRVVEGAQVAITVPEAADSHLEAEAIPPDIIYEDADPIVVNKPVGMVVHPAPRTPAGPLVNALMPHCRPHLSGGGAVT